MLQSSWYNLCWPCHWTEKRITHRQSKCHFFTQASILPEKCVKFNKNVFATKNVVCIVLYYCKKMQLNLSRFLLKATRITTTHQKWPNICKNMIISPIFHHKGRKTATKIDLWQNSLCWEQNINPSPAKMYMRAARTACNI